MTPQPGDEVAQIYPLERDHIDKRELRTGVQLHVERTKLRLGVHGLLEACLEDAIRVLCHGASPVTRNQFKDDVKWTQGRRKSAPGFSLEDICTHLGIDHDMMRDKLLQLSKSSHNPLFNQRLTSVSRQRIQKKKLHEQN